MKEAVLIQSAETFKNIGVIFEDTDGKEYFRGSGKDNHKAMGVLLRKDIFIEDEDEDGNVFSKLLNLSEKGSIKYIVRNLPTHWFVVKHLKGDKLDKERLFGEYCYSTGQQTEWENP